VRTLRWRTVKVCKASKFGASAATQKKIATGSFVTTTATVARKGEIEVMVKVETKWNWRGASQMQVVKEKGKKRSEETEKENAGKGKKAARPIARAKDSGPRISRLSQLAWRGRKNEKQFQNSRYFGKIKVLLEGTWLSC